MRVLLATDGSECAVKAAEALRRFPLPPESAALVLNAAPTLAFAIDLRSTVELQRRLSQMAEASVAGARSLIADKFKSVESRMAEGDAREAIIHAAAEWKADMIVLGSRGLGAVGSLFLGSVSLGVTRHAPCPVLIVKGRPKKTRRIVIGIDGSDHALAAARFVAHLPLDAATLVRLVAVVELPLYPAVVPDLDPALGADIAAATQELEREMAAAVERAKQIFAGGVAKVETAVSIGRPAHDLARVAARNADLVVVGARGVGGFERLLLGSVSDSVLRHAPCSVLVVKHG